jgi:hypothetical protein
MKEFSEYERKREEGADAIAVYRAARADGLTEIDSIRMLRDVFTMSLRQAKEVTIVATGTARNLAEHEQQLAAELTPRKFNFG